MSAPKSKPKYLSQKEIERQKAELRKFDKELTEMKKLKASRASEDYIMTHGAPKPIGEIMKDVKPELDQMLMSVQSKLREHREKYAPLIQSSPRTVSCPVHDAELCEIDFEATIQASYRHDSLNLVYFDCPECRQIRLVNEKHKKWLRMGVPMKVAHAEFDNFLTENDAAKTLAKRKVATQANRGRGFCLMIGSKGTGKSHLATCLLKYIGEGIFITQGEMIGQLRETYDSGGQEKLIAKFQKTPCLVIDEVDADLGGGEGERGKDITPFLYRILSYRYDRDLITCLTSNEDLPTLLRILGPRLEDRMAQNYVTASFTWDSYRRKHRTM